MAKRDDDLQHLPRVGEYVVVLRSPFDLFAGELGHRVWGQPRIPRERFEFLASLIPEDAEPGEDEVCLGEIYAF